MAENYHVSGPRAVLLINGKKIGRAIDVSVSENQILATVEELGDVYDVEHEPVGLKCTFNMAFIYLVKRELKALGIFPTGTTAQVVSLPPFDFVIYDQVGDQPLARVTKARLENRTFQVQARTLMSVNVSGRAIRCLEGDDA